MSRLVCYPVAYRENPEGEWRVIIVTVPAGVAREEVAEMCSMMLNAFEHPSRAYSPDDFEVSGPPWTWGTV